MVSPIDTLLDRVEWKCTICGTPREKGCDCRIKLVCPSCGRTEMTQRVDDDPLGPTMTARVGRYPAMPRLLWREYITGQEGVGEMDDIEVQRILAMSHDELIADCHARGVIPERIVEEVDRIISEAKVAAYRRRMKLYV